MVSNARLTGSRRTAWRKRNCNWANNHLHRDKDTTIGKGKQQLRDIPQSLTVVTERLMDDRNLDTVKKALKATAGISFQAAEGGEEDIQLRGFSLAAPSMAGTHLSPELGCAVFQGGQTG